MLSILFLAFHKKTDLVTGFSLPDHVQPGDVHVGLERGRLRAGPVGQLPGRDDRHRRVRGALRCSPDTRSARCASAARALLFNLIVIGLIFPYEATVIPLYYDFLNYHPAGINLAGSYWALILPQIGQSVTLGTFWMRAFFLTTPRALVEAGRIDGAGTFRILRNILLPQARPALLTLCLLVFIYTWNEFLLALVLLNGSDNTTAPLGLAFFAGTTRAGDPTKVAAASVLVAAPIVIVYLFLQRHFIRGVLAGAIKE